MQFRHYKMKDKSIPVKFVTSFANVKSSNVAYRVSAFMPDNALYDEYYATESRIWPAAWNAERGMWDKADPTLWFTNFMIFDLDFNGPDEEENRKNLQNAVNKLYELLGAPWCEIKNKNNYTQEQVEKYFTRVVDNGENEIKKVSLPKKFGMQLVYRMSEPIFSKDVERYHLFKSLRKKINILIDGDLQCHGFQFKNFKNEHLFHVAYPEKSQLMDLFQTAKKIIGIYGLEYDHSKNYTESMIDQVQTMRGYDSFEQTVPKSVKDAMHHVIRWYTDLNSFKGANYSGAIGQVNTNDWADALNFKQVSSRNETLMNFLRVIPMEIMESLTVDDINASHLLDHCEIKEPMDSLEFEATKNSVMHWRKENHVEISFKNHLDTSNLSDSIANAMKDRRVLKLNLKIIDAKQFGDDFRERLNQAVKRFDDLMNDPTLHVMIHTKKTTDKLQLRKFETHALQMDGAYGYQNGLANLLMIMYPEMEQTIVHMQNFFDPEVLTLMNETLQKLFNLDQPLTLYQLADAIKKSLYVIHFKIYGIVKGYRNGTEKPVENLENGVGVGSIDVKKDINEEYAPLINKIYESDDISLNDIKKCLKMFIRDGFAENLNDGRCKLRTIMQYQEIFHLSTSKISYVIRMMKKYMNKIMESLKCDSMEEIRNAIMERKKEYKKYLNNHICIRFVRFKQKLIVIKELPYCIKTLMKRYLIYYHINAWNAASNGPPVMVKFSFW